MPALWSSQLSLAFFTYKEGKLRGPWESLDNVPRLLPQLRIRTQLLAACSFAVIFRYKLIALWYPVRSIFYSIRSSSPYDGTQGVKCFLALSSLLRQSTLSFKSLFYEVAQIKHNFSFFETGSHCEVLAVLELATCLGRPWTHRDPSASASWVLALMVSAFTLGCIEHLYKSFKTHKIYILQASLLGASDFQILVITTV